MEIFLLAASDYRRTFSVDEYESFIWTERYNGFGEFQIVVQPTVTNKDRFKLGKAISHTESDQVMLIDDILIGRDTEGQKKMTVSGRSLESLLETRSIAQHMYYRNSEVWSTEGYIGGIATLMVDEAASEGHAALIADIIPGLSTANLTSSTEIVDVAIKAQSLYTAVKEICDSAGYGFRIRLQSTTPSLKFEVYEGQERKGVMFSSSLDNLSSETYFTSRKSYYNVAYVWARDGVAFEIVYARPQDGLLTGLDRRVMHVDASDIDPDPAKVVGDRLRKWLRQRGRQALASQKLNTLFDGELSNQNAFKYRLDYFLGDTVSILDDDGVRHKVKVTEFIWSQDQQGYRAFPTFTAIE